MKFVSVGLLVAIVALGIPDASGLSKNAGIPRRHHFGFGPAAVYQAQKANGLKRDALDDLLVLIEQGLDGILDLVGGNLEAALAYVQNLVDMLEELQAQSPEDFEQQLIDMLLQSLGTILGQIEDLLGITPFQLEKMVKLFHDLKSSAVRKPMKQRVLDAMILRKLVQNFNSLNRDALDDLLALLEQGLDGILELVDGNLHAALEYVQSLLDMLLELQSQSPESWDQQLIDIALQGLGTLLGQIEDMLGITP